MSKRLLLPFFLFLISLHANAGGFQVNAQGIRQLGMGHTGTGLCFDAGTLFFNPAACRFIPGKFIFNAGTTLLIPRSQYLEPSPGVYTETMVHHVGTPFNLYALWNPDKIEKLSVGLAVYTPFGSRAQWPDDWKGQFLIREIDLKTIFIQPTASWKINNYLGIGAGFVYATGSFDLRKGIPVQNNSGEYGEAKLHGAASGIGFNSGLYFSFGKISAGLSYRSAVKVKVENGSADFNVPSSLADYFPVNTFSTSITLPQVISGGLGYSTPNWKFALDVNAVGWHTYDTLRIDFATNTDKLEDVHDARCYKDAMIFRVGAEYEISEKISVRAGSYFDISPVQDGYLTPETPDANRLGLTAGGSFNFGNFSADVALLYIEGMKRTDTNFETGFSGTYKSRVIAPSFGIQYRFAEKPIMYPSADPID